MYYNKTLALIIKPYFAILLIITLFSFVFGQDRQITAKLNPGCSECDPDTILMYIKCKGSADTIHQIWDFTRRTPTVIFVVGNLDSSLNITWDRNLPKKFVMSEKPLYSFAAAIDKVLEYNDLDDNGHFDSRYPQKEYSLGRLYWSLNDSKLTEKEVMLHVTGRIRDDGHKHGLVRLKLDLLPFKDYAVDLPHLIHTANSTLIDISLVNLTTSTGFNSSRYAVHLLLVSTEDVTKTMHYTMRKSLDDEHTPGVFEIIEIKTPALYEDSEGGYLQFRPVGYTHEERNVASSTVAHVSTFNRTIMPSHSTLELFYRRYDYSHVLVQGVVLSFGDSGDGFYKNYNFTDWSFTMGYGSPPEESFSALVVIVIAVGLGVPVVLALSGVGYALVARRRRRTSDSRVRLTNED